MRDFTSIYSKIWLIAILLTLSACNDNAFFDGEKEEPEVNVNTNNGNTNDTNNGSNGSTDDSNTDNSNNDLTGCGSADALVKEAYAEDATRLAVGLINQPGSVTDGSVLISPSLIERMSDVLTAVHGSDFAARDSVISIYDVHIYPKYSLQEVVVEVNTDFSVEPWTQNWIDGNRFTGNPQADAIVATYELEIQDILSLGENTVIIFESMEEMNVLALVEDFEAISGVQDAGRREIGGDGDDIAVMALGGGSGYSVTYKVAYGDCENGCQQARFYEFNVSDECSVTYINTYGDAPPSLSERD